jgi:hypothetical protein
MPNPTPIRTEDGVVLMVGSRAYDYYNMKPGYIASVNPRDRQPNGDIWFEFMHDDGTMDYLNGQRICSIEFAQRRGFKGAFPTSHRPTA